MKARPTLATFFEAAAPATLASLIADIQDMVFYTTNDPALSLERMAMRALVANVGETEAEQLIAAARTVAA